MFYLPERSKAGEIESKKCNLLLISTVPSELVWVLSSSLNFQIIDLRESLNRICTISFYFIVFHHHFCFTLCHIFTFSNVVFDMLFPFHVLFLLFFIFVSSPLNHLKYLQLPKCVIQIKLPIILMKCISFEDVTQNVSMFCFFLFIYYTINATHTHISWFWLSASWNWKMAEDKRCPKTLLCARSFEDVRPLLRVEEPCVEVRGELRVAEAGWIVLRHVAHTLRVRRLLTLPVPPEPFAVEAGHWKNTPVDKNSQLGFVVPWGQRSGVQTRPLRRVTTHSGRHESEEKEGNCCHDSNKFM